MTGAVANALTQPNLSQFRAAPVTDHFVKVAVSKEYKIFCQPPYVRHYLYLRPQMAAIIAALRKNVLCRAGILPAVFFGG